MVTRRHRVRYRSILLGRTISAKNISNDNDSPMIPFRCSNLVTPRSLYLYTHVYYIYIYIYSLVCIRTVCKSVVAIEPAAIKVTNVLQAEKHGALFVGELRSLRKKIRVPVMGRR